MRKITTLLLGTVMIGLAGTSAMASDDVKTAEILAPWNGQGQVYISEPGKAKFMGAIQGTLYVQAGHKDMIDALPFICPTVQEMNLKSQTIVTQGDCQIGAGEDIIFAAYECSGTAGGCEGTFKLKGGTGKFAKISGGSKMSSRTKISEALMDATSGVTVKLSTGVMILPKLTFKVPAQ